MNTTTTKTDLAVWTTKVDEKRKPAQITVKVSSLPALTPNSRGHLGCEATIEIREVTWGSAVTSLTLTEDDIDTLRQMLFAASKELMYRRRTPLFGDNNQGGE